MLAVLVVLALLGPVTTASAEEPSLAQQMQEKLVRGAVNFSTGWLEIPIQIHDVWTQEGWVAGLFRGPVDGIGMFVARTVAGMVEIVTFSIPLPTYRPIIQPAYAWSPDVQPDVVTASQQ